ncbi:MAG: MFS transporter [Tepidisphaeraceae bacterium]
MKPRGISRNVLALGWVSFFTDLASEMLYPIMPLFLIGTLGASPAILGLVDGIAEGISSGLRWIAGALSDRWGRRKPPVFFGYLVSAVSKPVIGLATFGGWPIFLLGRTADRLGKSIRTSPRDALIADSTEPEFRGKAFGFHRAMDTCGAILGPLVALAVIVAFAGFRATFSAHWTGGENAIARLPLARLFYLAIIPGLISASIVLVFVREIRPAENRAATPPSILQSFPRPFWNLLIANAVFSLGNSSDAFLILRSGELGLGFGAIVLAYVLYNAIFAATATPLGAVSDRLGRKGVIAAGWIVYGVVYLGFAVWPSTAAPWVLLAVYGLYQALTDGVAKAMVSDLVPAAQRAGAIGLFYTVSGVGQLLASLVAGVIWNIRPGGVVIALAAAAGLALVAAFLISNIKLREKNES